jgi:hypothetical protein
MLKRKEFALHFSRMAIVLDHSTTLTDTEKSLRMEEYFQAVSSKMDGKVFAEVATRMIAGRSFFPKPVEILEMADEIRKENTIPEVETLARLLTN